MISSFLNFMQLLLNILILILSTLRQIQSQNASSQMSANFTVTPNIQPRSLEILAGPSPVAPVVIGAIHGEGSSGSFFGEYAYENVDQLALPIGNLGYFVIRRKLYGYRHGPFYGFGMFLDAPPFFGYGMAREGIGFNLVADVLASYNMMKGRLLSGNGLQKTASAASEENTLSAEST